MEGAPRVSGARAPQLAYPVPWDQVFGLTPYIARKQRRNIDEFTRSITARMVPAPLIEGLDRLPADPRFVLVANHYERKGLWILHSASVLTQAIVARYGPHPAPVRWMVTANWPPVRLGPWRFPSPGDWLLPKVADALWCYPVAFAGANPRFTSQSLRRILADVKTAERPLGIFPEGVAGSAGNLAAPLPGVGRLLHKLAKLGLPVVPAGIGEEVAEHRARLVVRFGAPLTCDALLAVDDAADLAMAAVRNLLPA